MKLNPLVLMLLICICASSTLAGTEHSVQELVPLPHPAKVVMAHIDDLKITPEQMARIKMEVVGIFPPLILPMIIQAEEMEVRILESIMGDGKTKQELASEIDELATLKRDLIDVHIDSLNTLKSILSDQQWVATRKLLATAD